MSRFINIFCLCASLFCLLAFTWNTGESDRKEKAFEVYTRDSIRLEVALVYNAQDLPDHYFSHVRTPVCEDGLCDLLVINLYWDLLGNFQKYELPKGYLLTKFDHEPFGDEDHQKLQKILADKRSLLAHNEVKDLMDEKTKLVSAEVDAVTGATKKSVEKAIVSGAVYSTHVLWHIVNGEIADKILPHTQNLWNDTLLQSFLASDHYPYQYYALDQLSEQQYQVYQSEILRLITAESIFVSLYAMDKAPASLYEDLAWQEALLAQYDKFSYRQQDKLLQKLQKADLSGESMHLLAGHMSGMNEKQLDAVLQLLTENKDAMLDKTVPLLVDLVQHSNPVFAKKAYQALQALKLKNRQAQQAIKDFEYKR